MTLSSGQLGIKLVGLEQDSDGVRATVRDHLSRRDYVVRRGYLLGADGGRRVPGLAGISYEGSGWSRRPRRCTCQPTSPVGEGPGRLDPLDLLPAHRAGVLREMRAQSMEFSELNVEYGSSYRSAAVVPDGTAAPAPADDVRVYQPSTRPGAPLPHAWIEDEGGNRRPVEDLVAPGRFLLIAGEDGHARYEAARGRGERPYRRGADRAPRR